MWDCGKNGTGSGPPPPKFLCVSPAGHHFIIAPHSFVTTPWDVGMCDSLTSQLLVADVLNTSSFVCAMDSRYGSFLFFCIHSKNMSHLIAMLEVISPWMEQNKYKRLFKLSVNMPV
jgi:hypothetical protein